MARHPQCPERTVWRSRSCLHIGVGGSIGGIRFTRASVTRVFFLRMVRTGALYPKSRSTRSSRRDKLLIASVVSTFIVPAQSGLSVPVADALRYRSGHGRTAAN